jgi:hypothetical protein
VKKYLKKHLPLSQKNAPSFKNGAFKKKGEYWLLVIANIAWQYCKYATTTVIGFMM